jgi:hypothetical protein
VSKIAFSQVSTATDKVIIDSWTKLEMPHRLEEKCYHEDYPYPCFPKTTLTLTYKGKSHSFPSYIAPWQGFFYVHFVKINNHSYAVDLDKDGFKEIAIYPEVAGNAAKTQAYIYTVKRSQLIPYGPADHYWESGAHVTNIKNHLINVESTIGFLKKAAHNAAFFISSFISAT